MLYSKVALFVILILASLNFYKVIRKFLIQSLNFLDAKLHSERLTYLVNLTKVEILSAEKSIDNAIKSVKAEMGKISLEDTLKIKQEHKNLILLKLNEVIEEYPDRIKKGFQETLDSIIEGGLKELKGLGIIKRNK